MTVSIPAEKTTKALNLIEWTLSKNKATIKWIQRLTGLLNFLNRAIVPGRTFTGSMYDKLRMGDAQGIMLKQHQHVHLDKQFKLDCLIWKQFLKNAQALQLCRKFVDWHGTGCVTAEQLTFYTDASKNPNLGMGGIFGDSWFFAQWDPLFTESQSPSIEFLELLALTVGVICWADQLCDRKIVIFNDNQAVINMVNNITSKCPQCMKLIRILTLDGIYCNRKIVVKYIPSKMNYLADALSRLDFECFWQKAPSTMNRVPDVILESLWPIENLWFS